jgi:hypothetical protein
MSSKKIKLLPTRPAPRADNECGVALHRMISEALIVCRATDPSLEATLASFLEIHVIGSAGIEASHDAQISGLLAAWRMLIYAHSEAEAEADELAEKLEFCIACLAARIERATARPAELYVLPQ